MRGTLAHLELISKYIVLFAGKKSTLAEKVTLAAEIIHLLRLARLHVVSTPGLSLARNFFSRQTYEHVILSCHSAVLLICALRDINPELAVALEQSGSDCCETIFLIIAGFGQLAAGRRDCSVGQAIEAISDANTLQLFRSDKDAPMVFGKRSHKADVDVRKHEDQSLRDSDLTVHEDDNGYVRAWRDGLARAEATAQTLGITVPRTRSRAWESERIDINQMRDARADEDAELAAAAAEPELTTESAPADAPAAASPPPPADVELLHLTRVRTTAAASRSTRPLLLHLGADWTRSRSLDYLRVPLDANVPTCGSCSAGACAHSCFCAARA
jgi:hypothetical protein